LKPIETNGLKCHNCDIEGKSNNLCNIKIRIVQFGAKHLEVLIRDPKQYCQFSISYLHFIIHPDKKDPFILAVIQA